MKNIKGVNFKILFLVFSMIFLFSINSMASELIDIETYDGYQITGKLDMADDSDEIPAVVIYVPGTGPCTYDNHRKIGNLEFNYFDLFAEELNKRGIAFFRYNTRGTSKGDTPPYYDSVDREVFSTNTPVNHANDVEKIVEKLKEIEALKDAKVILLGWSEGTVIAPLVVENNNVDIDAIFLAGYENETIEDTVRWQLTGGSSMIFYRQYFDSDRDGVISKEEFDNGPASIKEQTLQGTKFEELDQTEDGYISEEDFKIILKDWYDKVVNAFESGDDEWIWNNYFRISTDWYKSHATLGPNKERLLKLNLPIYIFHGTKDANVPVEGVYDIKERFEKAGKDNLNVYVFEGYDHDLNYLDWPLENKVSEGFTKLFNTIEEFVY